ncbi:low specificity L-threonine aldolase [Streptomyces sp. NRRL B-24572]|uniref:threonine aldolase family protein n=1 Tax=Streptomyces sp. NRRL B-24572 TaxID=1962156 RepID=UPI000A3BD032|nr:low specificity L-threonine aldolase [Streptomyces sp. NRRL B-24572]
MSDTHPDDVAGRNFLSDNTFGASPEVLEAVTAAAAGHAMPYGADPFTDSVRRRLGEVFERDVDVFLVSSGTAANGLALSSLSRPWGSILCHPDSHIDNDECGAAEFFTGGSKIVAVPGAGGRIDPDALQHEVRRRAGDVHSMRPSVLSISQGTESGGAYTLEEIRVLSLHAKSAGLGVHMDGARFANALSRLGASPAEMSWKAGVDVLSFGTTKNGTMTADAVISFHPSASAELAARVKRAGQLPAKARFHAAQLDAYLSDGLWLRNAGRANALASRLWDGLKGMPGVELGSEPEMNMVFCALAQPVVEELLAEGYAFYHDRWEPGVVRFVTSFSHSTADVDRLLASIRRRSAAAPAAERRPRPRDRSRHHCVRD